MLDGNKTGRFIKGENVVSCTFKNLPLLPQEYFLSIGIRENDAKIFLTASKEIGYFVITTRMKDLGVEGEVAERMAADSISPLDSLRMEFWKWPIQSFNLLNNVKTVGFTNKGIFQLLSRNYII